MKKPPYVLIDPRFILQGLLIAGSPYAWLVAHCLHGNCRPITVAGAIRRIHRVLHDPVFLLSDGDRNALYSEFLSRIDIVSANELMARVQIVVKSGILIPGMDENDIACLSPEIYKSLVGLEDDDPEETS